MLIAALANSKPAAPARRTEAGGLVVIRWAKNAGAEELQRASSVREVWFGAHGSAAVEGGYNEQGDRKESRGTTQARPPLTLYAPRTRTGYKAVVVFPDGKIEQHAWNQAKMILKDQKLKDGTPVDEVKLVVPLRELVFSIAGEATAAGFSAVLYRAGDGSFWNPDPPGLWLTPPVGSTTSTTPKTPKRPKNGTMAKPKSR